MQSRSLRNQEALLTDLLRAPLTISHVDQKTVESGSGARDEVVTTSRFILILKGRLTYTLEQQEMNLDEGTQLYVPAWTRRDWKVAGREPCEIVWVEFDGPSVEFKRGECFARPVDPRNMQAEKRRYLELLRLHRAPEEQAYHIAARLLILEGLLKYMLSRFFPKATEMMQLSTTPKQRRPIHTEIKDALRYFESNYARHDALETVYKRSALTTNYFRKCFKDAMQCSPQGYLQRLRLRHARHLVITTDWQLKRIAIDVGYDDPLYFSRLYARLWGISPRTERSLRKHDPLPTPKK